jgi:predicted protein tyrosine phosphatase
MKIDLTICGVHELPAQEGKLWTHVVSIWEKRYYDSKSCRKRVLAIAPEAERRFCFFDDVDDPNHRGAPMLRDVKRILDFTGDLPAKAKVLVHCRVGVSRSTAIAYAILCQHSAPGMEMENLEYIQTLRDLVFPNRLIIELADKILKREGAMLLHLHRPDE